MSRLAQSADLYYEKVASIQESMRQSEKRRLELEGELFSYSMSDRRISQIKCSKLHSYLKEISDREAQAKMRNLELLRDVKCIEISMKEYRPDHGPLHQQKADCLNKISKLMAARKKKQALESAKVDSAHKHQHVSLRHPAQNVTQPAVVLTGCQTSRGSDAEAAATSVYSGQALHRSPNRSVHSHERLPSGLFKDFRVGGEDAAGNRAHLSDDISGSNDSPDGCNLSDKHESTVAALPSVHALTGAAGNVSLRGDDEQAPSPPVTLMALEKNPLSPSSSSSTCVKNSPGEHADTGEEVHQPPVMEEAQTDCSHLMPEKPFVKESQDSPGRCQSVDPPNFEPDLSASSASDLSLSLTQSETDVDLPEDGACQYRDSPERSATTGGREKHNPHSPASSLHSEGSKDRVQLNCDSPASEQRTQRLSQEGLFYLLDSMEGRLHGEQTGIYGDASIEDNGIRRVIRLCNSEASLNEEDLEVCGAVVLRELQRLSWSTAEGCLLPEELVNAHQSSMELKDISTSLPPDAAQLWDRWFKHALLLKERHLLSTERLVQLFTPPLLGRHATYSHQAKVLLRTLLSRSSEECPSPQEEKEEEEEEEEEEGIDLSSSCGLPSLLADGGELKPARPVQNQPVQELQSTEEDSQDESPVESIPIRETKAYQLLKQSAMQERLQSSGEEEEEEEEEDNEPPAGINQEHEVDLGRAKLSSHQDPYPRMGKTNSKAPSVLQSKAFWGESEDSGSEIEAALRPQPFNTNNDDSDDFFD
ncbi:centrosomal protein kizuna [Genypterus blacodes]|uniref:centrosomal protein kizuna n=1 Tax=Genypterus blacodes TaxID=154954 RepID=UPI003F76356A